jgi:hypothetical protein
MCFGKNSAKVLPALLLPASLDPARPTSPPAPRSLSPIELRPCVGSARLPVASPKSGQLITRMGWLSPSRRDLRLNNFAPGIEERARRDCFATIKRLCNPRIVVGDNFIKIRGFKLRQAAALVSQYDPNLDLARVTSVLKETPWVFSDGWMVWLNV